jgi:hypothetical protein
MDGSEFSRFDVQSDVCSIEGEIEAKGYAVLRDFVPPGAIVQTQHAVERAVHASGEEYVAVFNWTVLQIRFYQARKTTLIL